MSYKTVEVIEKIMGNHSLKFTTVIDGKVKTAFYNKNGGISVDDNTTMVMGGKMLTTEWELVLEKHTFMEAINSNGLIKHESWKEFKPIYEALYELMDYPKDEVIGMINGNWYIKGQ